MLEFILDPLLGPLLLLKPIWAVVLIAFVISSIITIAYKFLTDQETMKKLKDDLKKHQEDMKKHRNDPDKMMKVQKEAMDVNMKYMMHSMRPTLFTMLPIFLIFGWLNAHLTYLPLEPDVPFEVSAIFESPVNGEVTLSAVPQMDIQPNRIELINENNATFKLTAGSTGLYEIDIGYHNNTYSMPIEISASGKSLSPEKEFEDNGLSKVVIHQQRLKPLGNFSIFGWKPGWLGTYIIFSIAFSMSIRKIFKIY